LHCKESKYSRVSDLLRLIVLNNWLSLNIVIFSGRDKLDVLILSHASVQETSSTDKEMEGFTEIGSEVFLQERTNIKGINTMNLSSSLRDICEMKFLISTSKPNKAKWLQ
jgi:hypothetical protein